MNNRLNKLFWSQDPKKLDKTKDKHLIIHQVLAYGSMQDIKYLFKIYSRETVKKVFLKGKKGLYDPKVAALIKCLLSIRKLDYSKYVKKIY